MRPRYRTAPKKMFILALTSINHDRFGVETAN
uniref:Uncharacterized protein n=1 Tax=Arundo donax TaxID=35708 RepID=A0A0A9BWP9_ARUDO